MKIISHDADQETVLSDKLEDDIVRGLDVDLEIIVRRLTGPPSDLDIVTITGMGGIGKTTLARKAYDHPAIRYHHFDILAWVTISQEFRCRNVLLEALHCISKPTDSVNANDYDVMEESDLADLVQKKLKGVRYLVVVDDIWSTNVWDNIKGIFPNYKNGSRILLTTRETKVAMYANTSNPHKMNLLNFDNSWKLFCDKVFGSEHEHFRELEEIGKEIVEKCQGLPLTISVIAGHVSKVARTLESWKDVARTLSEIIVSHPDKCLGVLGLSYHHLSNRLKACLLSMSSFPEDFEVETWRLIQLWIAEGFVRMSRSGKSLEEVAIDYLEDLISRNLIQARKRRFNGEIKTCGIHDLLHEFCLIEAETIKFMHVERTYPPLPEHKHNVCRFSFQTLSYSFDDWCELLPPVAGSIYLFSRLDLPFSPHIKPLEKSPVNCPIIHEFFSRFNLLRVLAIFNKDVSSQSFPLVITKLFHLRYLQVRFDGDIPESISQLQNLQTLICSGNSSEITLPENIWMMKNLRYIRMSGVAYLPNSIRENILNLEEFFGLCYFSCTKEVLSFIPNLKRLIVHEPLHKQRYFPDLELLDMSGLRKLEAFKCYSWRYSLVDISFKSYVLPKSLKRLSLNRCKHFLWEDITSTVTMLPNLEELKVKNCKTMDDVWRLSDKEFKSLKLLLLSGLSLERWEANSDNFPNLKRLVLKNCDDLQEIPTDFQEIFTLESIELHYCSMTVEDSARKIVQEQEETGNDTLKLYIHKSYYAEK